MAFPVISYEAYPCPLLLSRTWGEEIGGGGRVTGLYTKYHTYIKGVIKVFVVFQ